MEEDLLGYLNNQYGAGYKANISTTPKTDTGGLASMFKNFNFEKVSDITDPLSDIVGAYTGFKQLGLAEDAFKFNKDMKNKEYAMAKDAYDRNVARANSIGSQMQAGRVG